MSLDPLMAPSPLAEWQSIASARYEIIAQLRVEVLRLSAENARLSALADQWNSECDEMREGNKRLANELVLAAKDRDSAESHLAELFAQEPVAYLKFWAAQMYAGHGDIETDEGFEVCKQGEVGMDGHPAFPVFARPVPDAQAECTHDCNQGRDCTCQTPPAYHVPAAGKTIAVGKIILGATDGAEVDDWDVEWDSKAIDSINESRPANVNELPLFLATVK